MKEKIRNRSLKRWRIDMRYFTLIIFFSCLLQPTVTSAQETGSYKTEKIPVNGGELEYVSQGDGEPILFIHGAHISDSFLPMMKENSLSNYRLIRYHRRGHFESTLPEESFSIEQEAMDALTLLKHLEIEQAHVVGHSSGGVIAIQLALNSPDIVHSLTLIEPALIPDLSAFADWVKPFMDRYHSGDVSGAIDDFMSLGGGPDWKTEVSQTVPGGPQQAEKDARAFFEIEIPAMLQWKWGKNKAEQITKPVLYVNQSGLNWEQNRDRIQSWFPEAQYYLVDNVNHLLPMQDPESVSNGIANFLKEHRFENH